MAAKTDWVTTTNTGAVGNGLSTNNQSGFSAIPGGCRLIFGEFVELDSLGYWWSTSVDSWGAYIKYRYLSYNSDIFILYDVMTSNTRGKSIRLVKD